MLLKGKGKTKGDLKLLHETDFHHPCSTQYVRNSMSSTDVHHRMILVQSAEGVGIYLICSQISHGLQCCYSDEGFRKVAANRK